MKKIWALTLFLGSLNSFSQPCSAFAGADRILCSGSTATLGSAPSAGLLYVWNPSTGLSNSHVAQPVVTASGTITYTLTVSGHSCTTNHSEVTISVPEPDLRMSRVGLDLDNITDVPVNSDYYYWYESAMDSVRFSSNSAVGNYWIIYHINGGIGSGNPIDTSYSTDPSYKITFTGNDTNYYGLLLRTRNDQGSLCSGGDVTNITGYPVNNVNQYPPGSLLDWNCALSLPATIYQANMGSDSEYHWGYSVHPSDWTYSNILSNSADIDVPSPGSCPDNPYCNLRGGLYLRALHYTNAYGYPLVPWQEVIVNYGVGIDPGCRTTNTSTVPNAPGLYKSPSRAPLLPFTRFSKNSLYTLQTPLGNKLNTGMALIPNPATNTVRVQTTEPILQIEIYSNDGKLIKHWDGNKTSQMDIMTRDLSSSSYICVVRTSKETLSRVLLIQR